MTSYDPSVPPDPAAWRALDEATALALVSRHHRSAQCEHPSAPNPRLHAAIHVIVENQAALGPATPVAATLARLVREGLSRHEAVHAVGSVEAEGIHRLLRGDEPAGEAASILDAERLERLTAESWLQSAEDDADNAVPDDLQPKDLKDYDDDDLIELLFNAEDRLPRKFVDEALARSVALTPAFIAVVIDPRNWGAPLPAWWAPVHATFLLGAIDDAVADAALFSAMRDAEKWNYDWICQEIPSILGRRGQRVRDGLRRIIQDRGESNPLRATALRALAATTLVDHEGADAVFGSIGRVFADTSEDFWLRGDAGDVLLDFQVAEYREALAAFARESVKHRKRWELVPFSVDDVERVYGQPRDLQQYQRDWLAFYDAAEIAARQARWAREDEERTRTQIKVGRNDPCPCGSGKKYKKCCLA